MKNAFVHRELTLWTMPPGDTPQAYIATATYLPDDPFAVELAIRRRDGRAPDSVLFARALLIDGLLQPVGDGAVHVAPHPAGDDEWILLILPVGRQLVEFYARRERVEEFVDATCLLVPSSREEAELDLDDVIAHLLETQI